MKHELLVPVGDYECLISAIYNGADAVYLGGKRFGARKFATNFNDDEMIKAIKTCHLYGVKIYVTVNTIIYEEEVNDYLEYIKFLYLNNVDAVIMQDIGMIKSVRKLYPNLIIHASTQMHNHNLEQLKLLSDLGVKRVVLAREYSLEDIKKIKTDLELEVFIHGALCICYSGQCLFSSLILNRSGNRGECAGMCRLPFRLLKDNGNINTQGDYLLSPKEVCTIPKFKEFLDSNITSFKIEGRMKSATYVGYITRLYRKLMDGLEVTSDELDNLKIIFNREFTLGHLFNEKNDQLMNIKNPNHQGLYIGDVVNITNKYVSIKLNHDLHQEDGIRFINENAGMIVNFLYNEKELLINEAHKGDTIMVLNRLDIKELGPVHMTTSKKLTDSIMDTPEKKIRIDITVNAILNKPLSILISDNTNTINVTGDVVEAAKNAPISKEKIMEQMSRLGETPFVLNNCDVISDDGIFIVISKLNELRREAVDKLISARENMSYEHPINEYHLSLINNTNRDFKVNILVRNEEQLKCALENEVNLIYVTDYNLYLKYKHLDNVYYRLNRVLNNHPEFSNEHLLISETGSLIYSVNNTIRSDYYLNVVNEATLHLLTSMGVKGITLSVENSLEQIKNINNLKNYDTEVIVYGYPEVMIMKHCLLNMLVNHEGPCNVCKGGNSYTLLDRNNEQYKIINDEHHLTHIMNCHRINRINEINELHQIGVKAIRIELLDEDYLHTESIIKDIYRNL